MNWRSRLKRFPARLSFTGFLCGALFFSLSLTPSLLPRHELVQGLLSGLALAAGYGLGVASVWLWRYLELHSPNERTVRAGKRIATPAVLAAVILSLWRATVWQNSIRELMEMPPLERAYAPYVVLVAVIVAAVVLAFARLLLMCLSYTDRQLKRFLPARVSYVLSALLVVLVLLSITNKIIVKQA